MSNLELNFQVTVPFGIFSSANKPIPLIGLGLADALTVSIRPEYHELAVWDDVGTFLAAC